MVAGNRDSFELHALADPKTAHFVAQSFDRIWQLATPVPACDETELPYAVSLSALAATSDAPQVLTRH